MSLQVIKAGVADSIRDKGRKGYEHLGINATGAMDVFAMQIANILVGNDRNEAVLELHYPVSKFMFTDSAIIALAGADFKPTINNKPIKILQPIVAEKNDVLVFKKIHSGARCYLAIRGGFAVRQWLGSKSTNTKAIEGGYKGRYLQKGDSIEFCKRIGNASASLMVLPWRAAIPPIKKPVEIYFVPGHEWDWLSDDAKQVFLNSIFIIHSNSDIMGYRVENKKLPAGPFEELISTAVHFGTVQLLPDGSFIILMADHQTTGGYPRIAHVISAHQTLLAQLKPGDDFVFKLCTMEEAEELLLEQHNFLVQLQHAVTFKWNEYSSANRY